LEKFGGTYMGGSKTEKIGPCWEYFDCKEEFRKICPVYQQRSTNYPFCEGWFIFKSKKGGPAQRGPCSTCEIFISYYPEIKQLLQE
jgi:hypothetical protein